MKKLLILSLSITILISACIDYEIYNEPANIIMQNYGGEITYGPGVAVGKGSKGNKYDYLSVELSNSLFLQYGINPTYVISHIATEFAKVTPENISEIQVELSNIPLDDEIKNFSETISIEEAQLIISKEDIMHNCFDKIATNNISELTPCLIDEYITSFTDNNGESAIKGINELIGEYQGSMFRGYDFMKNDSIPDKDFILLNGLLMGSDQNAIVSVIIDPEKPDSQCIVSLRY